MAAQRCRSYRPRLLAQHWNVARQAPLPLDPRPIGTLNDVPPPIAGPPDGEVALAVPVVISGFGGVSVSD